MESGSSRFCLKCGYDLVVAPYNQCPECGQRFHPDHPITFLVKPIPSKLNRILISLAWSFALSSPLILIVVLMPEGIIDDHGEFIMISIWGAICLGVAIAAVKLRYFLCLLGTAIGSQWGFLITLITFNTLQHMSIARIDWPRVLIALGVLPVVTLLFATPIWFIKRFIIVKHRHKVITSQM